MSTRENLSALLATRGKGGSVESISQAGKHFSNDKTLTPSDFITVDKLDASKAITLIGGYAVKTYGIEPKVAYSMRNAFAKKYAQVLPLFELDKAGFISAIEEIDVEIANEANASKSLEISLGKVDVRSTEQAIKALEAIINSTHPEVAHNLQIIAKLANDKLAFAPLQQVAQVA
jgi:hypothetical protein